MALPKRPLRSSDETNLNKASDTEYISQDEIILTVEDTTDPVEDTVEEAVVPERNVVTDFLDLSPEVLDVELDLTPGKDAHYNIPERTIALVQEKKDVVPSVLEQAYKKMGEITVDQAINQPYQLHAHLEDAIYKTTQYIQQILSDKKGQAQIVAEARRNRGSKLFKETSVEIDRLVLRRINNGEESVAPQDVKYFVAAVNNEILGFGPLEPLWGSGLISEVIVNGPHQVYVEVKGQLTIAKGVNFRDADHLLTICQQMLSLVGRRIDVQSPYADGTLPDGSRFNVIHQEIAPHGPLLTIRRFPDTAFSLKKLVEVGSMNEAMAEIVGNVVHAGVSIIIVGGTGSGKTSALNALSGCIPDGDRVITIEDTLELRLNARKHVAAMQSRPASAKGTGAVTIRDLVRNSLRMRPDRVIVGEVRDASAYDMMQAMNTGHEGSLTTVHANDANGAVERISLLVSEAGEVTPERALSLIAGGVDAFLVIKRYEDGSRRVKGLYEVPSTLASRDGKLYLEPIPLWEFVQDSADEDEAVTGHYAEMNKISDSLIAKHSLNKRKHLSLEELYDISEIPEVVAPTEGDLVSLAQ